MKTAIIYLCAPADIRDQQVVLVPQANALGSYCQENNIDIIEVFYELNSHNDRPQRTKMIQTIYSRKLNPDLLLFTTLEVFSEDLCDALHLHHILAKFGVTTKAILQPNLIFASMPKS